VQEILKAARTSEATHLADSFSADEITEMATNIKQLITKLSAPEVKPVAEQLTNVKSVTFAQAAIGEAKSPFGNFKTYSPSSRSASPGGGDRRQE
jgi:hypothetical protein